MKHSLRNWIATPLILVYMATLVVSAWPSEIRPAALDALNARATALLFGRLGIVGGEPVFHAEEESDWLRRAFCVKVRGSSVEPERIRPRSLFPPGGGCQVDGFRFRLPPVDRALHRLLVLAFDSSDKGLEPSRRSDRYLERIGRHFCTRPKPNGDPQHQVDLIWYWYYENYVTGEVGHRNALLFRFECDAQALTQRRWTIDNRAFAQFWGGRPWE